MRLAGTAGSGSRVAREELDRYAAERRTVRDAPPALIPFGGAGSGAGIYAAVLLIVAYCAGIQWFGMDWLASGALDAACGRAANGGAP